MFCTYHKPRKCEHMRLCHLELMLLIILFLGGMFAQTSSTSIKKLLLAHLMDSCLSKKFFVRFFLKYISLYLIWDTVCFKLF